MSSEEIELQQNSRNQEDRGKEALIGQEDKRQRFQSPEILAASSKRLSTAQQLKLPWIVPAGQDFWFYQESCSTYKT